MHVIATGLALSTDVDASLRGASRWNALARRALADCATPPDEPLIVATCNGGIDDLSDDDWSRAFDPRALLAGTPWASPRPVVSASCVSGMQALWWARVLLDAGAPAVTVLACDTASAASLANFDSLRILAPSPPLPWQGDSPGFVHGELAAAVRVRQVAPRSGHAVHGTACAVFVGTELEVGGIAPGDLVIGQGTGPAAADEAELGVVARFAGEAPIASLTYRFGHALGASSLLPIVAVARGMKTGIEGRTRDGRVIAGEIERGARATILCRALAGACGIVSTHQELPRVAPRLGAPAAPAPAFTPAVRTIVENAAMRRPERAPAALVVVLERPLRPPERARRGGRLFPSAVLEITPGFVATAVARAWGYAGPVLTLVNDDAGAWIDAAAARDGEVCVLYVRGDGDERQLEWGSRAGG